MEEELNPLLGGARLPGVSDLPGGGHGSLQVRGYVRATVEGCELADGRVWLRCRATLDFKVPASHVVGVEREGE